LWLAPRIRPQAAPVGASAESDISHDDALQDGFLLTWRDQFVSRITTV
jgi:hypothetical protein